MLTWTERARAGYHAAVSVQVSKGFEYAQASNVIVVDDDTSQVSVRLKRIFDLSRERWYSGDTHVHFVSSFGGLREAAAEGIGVVNLLLSQWGSLFSNFEDFVGRPVVSSDNRTVLYASQENREHVLGHLSLLGLKQPIMPWCTGGAAEAEMGSGLEVTLSHWADRCHEQGGTVVVPHFQAPNGELAVLLATGRADALEMLEFQERTYLDYYRYLNAGFRVPLAGGTDKMSNDVPIGLCRTYARLGSDEDFNFDTWCAALKAGRSYMTSGPLLDLEVEGAEIGDTVYLPEQGGTISVNASARSIFPMFRMELVLRGDVIAASESISGTNQLSLREEVVIDGPGWICVRVGGGADDLTLHRDEWRRAIMAHSSPVYIACGERRHMADRVALEYAVQLVERGRSYATQFALTDLGADVRHHHGGDHLSFLSAPFGEARAELDRRLASSH